MATSKFPEEARPSDWLKILLTGIVSLIVGVSSGSLLQYFQASHPRLVYDSTVSDVFAGQTANFALMTLRVENSGNKEVENLLVRVVLDKDELKEFKVSGLPPSASSQRMDKSSFQLDAAYLNPKEEIAMQLLVSPATSRMQPPVLEIRGKGVIGTPRKEPEKASWFASLGSGIVGVLAALSTALLATSRLRLLRTPKYTTHHSDDQRDIFPYLLELNGLLDDAERVRSSNRKLMYWSEVDRLTTRYIAAAEAESNKRLIRSVEELLDYAAIDDCSCLLINFDLARLYIAVGDHKNAIEKLALARSKKHPVIEKRLKMDTALSQLVADPNQDGTRV